MNETRIKMTFQNEFIGELVADNATAQIGKGPGELRPYDLLLGALGSCYYATFVDVAKKMRLEYERAEIDIHGVKRDEVPTTLKTVTMTMTIIGAQEDKKFQHAAELAAKYCSVHETIKQVADITLQVNYS